MNAVRQRVPRQDVAGRSKIVLASLNSPAASRAVALETTGAAGSKAAIYVETSIFGDGLATVGKQFVDAPVSGGPDGAWAGTLFVRPRRRRPLRGFPN